MASSALQALHHQADFGTAGSAKAPVVLSTRTAKLSSSSIVPTTHARATIAAKSRVELEGNVGPQTQTACVGGPVWIGVGIWLFCRRCVGSLLAGLMTAHIRRPV
ncbi:hypothetical protein, partial [Mesorhizobium sp. M1A.F.Ca.IN.020.03.2.1]|uniref:hypothetical protein n=1 Tax=Mesorhizobium sp. M1A.F.Ca.IN.020.03.2.1 TaxID=2496769 RepID=UPI0019D42BE7